MDWQDSLEVRTLPAELSSLGLNPVRAINCHPGVLQAELGLNPVRAINYKLSKNQIPTLND